MLLPSDRYLAELLGLTEEQYEQWRDEVRSRAQEGPQPAVVAGIDPVSILVTIAISVGLQLIGLLLAPSPPRPNTSTIRQRQIGGRSQTNLQNLAPRAGFDAVQDVAAIGEPIPVIYANRETISGVTYGGVRINTSLLWSQIWSLGGSQLLRAVFMTGEGDLASIDVNGFAIGDSTLGTYDLGSSTANDTSARITVYARSNGGRIQSADRIAGRLAANDPGNAQNDGGADVFMARGIAGSYDSVFCASSKPASGTTFGVYTLIGNNLGFKLNPQVRPGVTARLIPAGRRGDLSEVVCDIDQVVEVQRKKETAFFSTRSGIISGSFGLGDTFTYRIDRSSDFETVFASTGQDGGAWSSAVIVSAEPTIYVAGTTTPITGLNFAARMTVSAVSVSGGGDELEITATFDVATVLQKLIDDNAARGQYVVEYFIQASNANEAVQAPFDITITVQPPTGDIGITSTTDADGFVTSLTVTSDAASNQYAFSGAVLSPSGPVTVLTDPARLQSVMRFDVEDLDAYTETAADVASTVAGRQKTWDDALIVGELYKVGSAVAVVTSRTPSDKIFVSDSEDGAGGTGETIDVGFEVVRAGSAATVAGATITADGTTATARTVATNAPHILRCAIGNITTNNECRIVELGFRSTVGTTIRGLCNFRDTLTLSETDGRACTIREGSILPRGKKLNVDVFQSGIVSTIEERYSFFKVSFREAGSGAYTTLAPCFGIRGSTDQPSFNFLSMVMPSLKRWEYRLEPLSGWEIRSGTATGDLVILDAKLTSVVTATSEGVTWRSNGEIVARSTDTFTISTARRGDIGLPRVDGENYLDDWGKLAEAFVYEEAQSSAASGPEHEIVYVNEIRENDTAPLYDGIAITGVNARSSFEWSQFSQWSAYVTGGTKVRRLLDSLTEGPSHLLPDLALDRLTNPKYGPGRISDDLINLSNFAIAAQWCLDRKYFFDGGVLISEEAPRQWIADTAGAMLLDFREVNGRYDLVPFITFGTVEHKALFTAGNIQDGSFKYESIPLDDRQPSQVSVRWRQERSNTNPTNPGLFPEDREVLVREASPFGSDSAPFEAIDLSNFCTNENHAIDVAKFTLRMRRLRDHRISFRTTYDGIEGISTGIGPGDYIRFALDVTVFNEFNNGVVLQDGTVVSTTTLADGSYNVVSWTGEGNVNDNGTLVVSGGKAPASVGTIFTVKQTTTQVRTYQISKITPAEDGVFDVEAVHMPTDAAGMLLVAADWDNAGSWVIKR